MAKRLNRLWGRKGTVFAERYHDGVIAYSLGNSLFDSGGREKRRSVVLEVVLDASGPRPVARSPVLHPVLIHPSSRSPLRARRGGYRGCRHAGAHPAAARPGCHARHHQSR